MTTANLDFATLVPERDTFTDGDGTVYEFRSRRDLGAVDRARLRKMQHDASQAQEQLDLAPDDEKIAQTIEQRLEGFIQTILPELPEERIHQMTMDQKNQILRWWNVQNAVAQSPNGSAPPGEAVAG